MMRSATKLRTASVLGGVLLLVVVLFAAPLSNGYPTFMNENVKGLDADTPVLAVSPDVDTTDFEVSYVYHDADGEKITLDIDEATHLTVDAGLFDATVRSLEIDFTGMTPPTTEPDYLDSNPTGTKGHYVLIEFPELADILWEDTVRSFCTGVDFLRNENAATTDNDTISNPVVVSFGAGTAELFRYTATPEEAGVGDANSNEAGTCQDRKDVNDLDPEFETELDVKDIQDFLLAAYVKEDSDDPEPFWVKIYGPRVPVTGAEDGDSVDFGIQFYSYAEDVKTDYSAIGGAYLTSGAIIAGVALLITAAFNVSGNEIKSNVNPLKRGGR